MVWFLELTRQDTGKQTIVNVENIDLVDVTLDAAGKETGSLVSMKSGKTRAVKETESEVRTLMCLMSEHDRCNRWEDCHGTCHEHDGCDHGQIEIKD